MLNNFYGFFVHFFSNLNIYFGYFLFFIVAFLEFFVFTWWLVPGTTIMLIWWILVKLWIYSFWELLAIWFLWSFIWSFFSYSVWLKFKDKLIDKWFLFLSWNFFKKAKNIYQNYHSFSIVFWKLLIWVKETISFIAWVFHIKELKFFVLNVISSFLWVLLSLSIGYLFSFSFDLAFTWLNRIWFFIFIIFVILFFLAIIRYYLIVFWKIFLNLFKLFFKWLIPKKIYNNIDSLKVFVLFIVFVIWYLLFAFLWILKWIYKTSIWTYIDISVSNLLNYLYYNKLAYIFYFISFWWKTITICILASIFSLYLFKKGKYKTIYILWWWIIATVLITVITKYIVWRHRPELMLYNEIWFSFPSAHSSLAVFFYGYLFYYFLKNEKNLNKRVNIIMLFLLIVILIGFSRLYLQVHYVSDVFGWYFLWFSILLFAIILKHIKHDVQTETKKMNLKVYVWVLFFILFIYFYYYSINVKFEYKTNKQQVEKIENVVNLFKNHPNLIFTTTMSDRKTEPINFIIIAPNDKSVYNLFKKSWFYLADKLNIESISKLWLAVYDNVCYKNAPMTPLFWQQNIQIFGFQKQEKWNLNQRHHIRIWKSNYAYKNNHIYVAVAVYDDKIKWGITHKINPDLDKEREYFFNKLKEKWWLKMYKKIQILPYTRGKNFSGDEFFTDGKVYIVWVK